MSRQLTLEIARELAEGTDIREIKKLDASKRGIALVNDLRYSKLHVSQKVGVAIICLCTCICSPCVELARLDLSHNSVTDLEGLCEQN